MVPLRSATARALVPTLGHCWPMPLQETLKHSKSNLAQSLWGIWVLVCTQGFAWALWASLVGMGFYSKYDFYWRRQWQTTPVLLPGKSHEWRSLVGCSPWGHEELDTTEWLHFHALEKEMATHSSVLAWTIPGTGEPGGLPSMGSHRVGHDWSNLAAVAAVIFIGASLCPWMWDIFFWWDPKFSCQWLFSSELQLWSSHRRKLVHILLLCHLNLGKNRIIKFINWR